MTTNPSKGLEALEFEDEALVRAHPQTDWQAGHFWERGMEMMIAGSTLFLEFLPDLEEGYTACARAVEAGGITTIADMEFPMMEESLEEEMCDKARLGVLGMDYKSSRCSRAPPPSSPRTACPAPGSSSRPQAATSPPWRSCVWRFFGLLPPQAIKTKAAKLNNDQLHMFTDHVKVTT